MKRIVKWLPLAGMGVLWAGAALASTTGILGIDTPINAGTGLVYNGLAAIVGVVGGTGTVRALYSGHHGEMAGIAVLSLTVGSILHHWGDSVAPAFGAAGAATIQLVHHVVLHAL